MCKEYIDMIKRKAMMCFVIMLALILPVLFSSGCTHVSPGKIVFVSERDGNQEIYVMDADGSNQTRLTDNQAIDEWPNWSP